MTSGGLLGVWGKWVKHTKYIYNIQDFNPEQVLAVGYTKSKFITDILKVCLSITQKITMQVSRKRLDFQLLRLWHVVLQ